MNKQVTTSSLITLRTAAHQAAVQGHYEEARGIYKRILKALEDSHGRSSQEYETCLYEAGLSIGQRLSKSEPQ